MKLSRQNAPVYTRQTVQQAFVALMEQHLFYLGRWEPVARSPDDIEGVHQLRVALRRMRSALRIFRPALPREITRPWGEEMRYLAGQLGPARDLDVFLDEGLGAVAGKLPLPGEASLRHLAETHRVAAYETVRTLLDSDRYTAFKRGFADWLATESWLRGPLEDKHRERLDQPVVDFARRVLKKHRKRVLRQGDSVDPSSDQDLHRLRIECKKLRYAGEFFEPLFPGLSDFIGHLKSLQDVLGVMNDVAVTRSLLERLLEGVNDAEVRQYGAALLGWRCCVYYRLRDDFTAYWQDFRDTDRPW